MEWEKREQLAALCLESGALFAGPGEEPPLGWRSGRALEAAELRQRLTEELTELVREHYSAGEAVLGDRWAEEAAAALKLPFALEPLPLRPILILDSASDIRPWLPRLTALRESGGSPAIAVVWNGGEEDLRLRLDRADIRCHWLLDLESAAAAALQRGLLELEDYCRLIPQE